MVTHERRRISTTRCKTPQFWLIWAVLCLNVSAGIGVIGMASPMLQEIFGGALIGQPETGFAALTPAQKAAIAAIAAGFVGLLSACSTSSGVSSGPRSPTISAARRPISSSSCSASCSTPLLPTLAHSGQQGLFVAAFCVILSMYGGGFATVPAYLADMFGTRYVGAIHGRLLTAWSAAGVVGPFVIANPRQSQIAAGVEHNLVYDGTLHILAVLLAIGLVCNLLIRPVADKHHMSDAQLEREHALQHEDIIRGDPEHAARGSFGFGGALAWAGVGAPFLIGVYIALSKASALF